MVELQRVFANLELTIQTSYNPVRFVDALSLSHDIQQDGQEFCKLFTSILERQLSGVGDVNMMHECRGKYFYQTTCDVCSTPSVRDSVFDELELQIKGMKTLEACLEAYFRPESLCGANRYHCDHCDDKRDARREIKLRTLPSVLNLHLLRFNFDMKTMSKKKLTEYLEYPEVLDLAAHMPPESADGCSVYDLEAILLHRGPTASSGHYVSRVKDSSTRRWVEFDDSYSQTINSERDGLGDTSEFGGSKQKSKSKRTMAKNVHRCKNVYMLVYRSRRSEPQKKLALETPPQIDAHLRAAVVAENVAFQTDRDRKILETTSLVAAEQVQSKLIFDLYKQLGDTSTSSEQVWVPTAWIEGWLATGEATEDKGMDVEKNFRTLPVPLSTLHCSHRKLDPSKVSQAKLAPRNAVETLANTKGWKVTWADCLCLSDTCPQCVQDRIDDEVQLRKLRQAQATVDGILRPSGRGAEFSSGYFVAKDALRQWKLKSFDPTTAQPFNHEARCEHGQLIVDDKYLAVVPVEAWSVISGYIKDDTRMVEIPTDGAEPCCVCQTDAVAETERLAADKVKAQREKDALCDLFRIKSSQHRPTNERLITTNSPETVYAVPIEFVLAWRAWCRAPRNQRPLLDYKELLCEHGKFLFDVEKDETSKAVSLPQVRPGYQYVTEDEWRKLTTFYNPKLQASPIKIFRSEGGIRSSPECCIGCREVAISTQQASVLEYTDAVLWVRRGTVDSEEASAVSTFDVKGNDDSSVSGMGDSKGAGGGGTRAAVSANRFPRRSTLSRTGKGCKKIIVDSTTQVLDIRVMITQAFNVMPMDQHLFYEGIELKDANATLSFYRVPANSVLVFTVDAEKGFDDGTALETGFQGTSLLSPPLAYTSSCGSSGSGDGGGGGGGGGSGGGDADCMIVEQSMATSNTADCMIIDDQSAPWPPPKITQPTSTMDVKGGSRRVSSTAASTKGIQQAGNQQELAAAVRQNADDTDVLRTCVAETLNAPDGFSGKRKRVGKSAPASSTRGSTSSKPKPTRSVVPTNRKRLKVFNQDYAPQLDLLRNMGFVDEQRVKELLGKYNGDVHQVSNALVTPPK
jgi:ubiquitin carboxyl-terminal hydrolase 48